MTEQKTLVFIHGNSCHSSIFERQLTNIDFQKDFLKIAIDLPGHGLKNYISQLELSCYSIPKMAEFVSQKLKELKISQPVIVGHSLGGHIAIALSKILELSALFLINTPPLDNASEMADAFYPSESLSLLFKPELSEKEALTIAKAWTRDTRFAFQISQMIRQVDPQFKIGLLQSIQSQPELKEREQLKGLRCPIKLLFSSNDSSVNYHFLDQYSFLNPMIEILETSSHFPFYEDEKIFNESLNRFLVQCFK